jgi:4a-hydroxytetrahydrobiopterin dehydratase
MPTLLDDGLVADALTALSGWSGDAHQISRTVALEDAAAEALLAAVAVTAAALNHHPDVERAPGAVVFTLSTHSAGGVTEYDVALASRIDDLILKVTRPGGGEGAATTEQPAEQPPTEQPGPPRTEPEGLGTAGD